MIEFSSRFCALITALFLCVAVPACTRNPDPQVVVAGGLVTLDGQPLSRVLVRFVPMTPDLPGSFISTGITDDQGKFTLDMGHRPGVVVGPHRVTVEEGPLPDEVRESQTKTGSYLSSLKLRPIPSKYASIGRTPLSIDVEVSSTRFELALTR